MRCLSLFLLCALPAIISAEPDIRIIAGIEEEEKALVGQRRTFFIEIQTETWFSGPIEITPPALDGVILAQLEAFGINGTIRQDGTTFTTHRKEFTLFALNPGSVVIPPGKVRAQIADPGNPPITYTGESPEIVFEAVMPDGVRWEGPLLTTRSLTLRESWDHEPGPGMVGDAFQRTISIEADDILGMVFPPFPAPDTDGVRIYRDAPRVEDKTGRGGLTGSRSETLTYVFEKPGQVTLPPFSLFWWDERSATLKEERLPEYEFEIAPLSGDEEAGAAVQEVKPSSTGFPGSFYVILVVGVGLVAFLLRWWIGGRIKGSTDAEKERFSILLKALEAEDAPGVYRAWKAWFDLEASGWDEPLAPVLGLEKAATGYSDEFDRPALRECVIRLRERRLHAHGDRERSLPSLNP